MTSGTGYLTLQQRFVKRAFDIVMASLGLLLTGWLIAIGWTVATLDTRKNGFFIQPRIGRFGRPFRIIKLRTMRDLPGKRTMVTTSDDARITKIGRLLRRTKLDELPQLVNVLLGQMSFVGPRPDVAGFADQLTGNDRSILNLRPGITGPATLYFRNEEDLLAQQDDPETYNREVIFPTKLRLNREYAESYSFSKDLKYIVQTLLG